MIDKPSVWLIIARMTFQYTQVECDRINALREFEAAHKIWMNTSVFTEAGKLAKANKDAAMKAFALATERAGR